MDTHGRPRPVGSSTTLPPLPIDEEAIAPPPPAIERPTEQPFQPELSLTSGVGGLIAAPSAVSVPRSALALSGAWIFLLGVPLVVWERKRAVSAVAGVGAGDTVPVYATRNSMLPLAYLRPDATMLWWRFRFMGLGEGQRVQVQCPLGRVWIDRDSLQPLHEQLESRETD